MKTFDISGLVNESGDNIDRWVPREISSFDTKRAGDVAAADAVIVARAGGLGAG